MLSKFIENPWRIFNVIAAKGLLNWMPDKAYLKLRYRASLGKKLDLNNPRTFNEKMQWLKLYDHRPEYAKMVDKYEVKKYVADIIGEEYIIPTLGIWDSFDEIDFEGLPSQFVLKCTHDSGGLVICKDKDSLDIEAARKKIEKSMRVNYFKWGREWPYKQIKPRIIAEQYMDSGDASGIMDYKVHNFNGIPKIVLVCSERFSDSGLKEDFFDDKWRHLDLCRPSHSNSDYNIEKPESFDKMLELSRILANKIPFVRTDFYEVEGKLYFGELTFYPASGMEGFCPDDWDNILGSWLTI